MDYEQAQKLAVDAFSRIEWPRVMSFCAVTLVVWWLTGYLKRKGVLATEITRKINHVWALVGGVVWFAYLPPPNARPSMLIAAAMLFTVLLTACRFPNFGLLANIYHGYSRESDGDRQGFNIWSSWLLGIYGLGMIDALCRDMMITRTAALIVGIGDGLAEPIGKRFGRITYPVARLPATEPSRRSLEGSFAVLVGTFAVAIVCFATALQFDELISLAIVVAALTTITEAISPHGTDNFTIPVVSGLAIRFHPAYASLTGM